MPKCRTASAGSFNVPFDHSDFGHSFVIRFSSFVISSQCIETRLEAWAAFTLGRIARDKGVLDLASAFATVATELPHVRLLIVGPDEDGIQQQIRARAGAALAKLRFSGITDAPEQVLAAADVICLPSYREAFGMVILEAAAMGIPAVASRIYGITDALVEGETGLLHEASNPLDLASQMKKLAENPELRRALGEAAHARVHREFRSERVIGELLRFYDAAMPDETRAPASP